MISRTWLVSAIGRVTVVSWLVAGVCYAEGIPRATDAPKPLKPEESLKRFQLEPGFRIELVASEPYVADPVAMAFDARGRIFVCEIHGYNLEGYLDVLELNKTGELDKAVRRIPANPKAREEAAKNQYGTVKLLEDADGDGRVDRAVVWADHLPPCYGVVPARQGVIVLCAPDIVYLADRDDDGKAEVREKLFTGFGAYDLWSRISNPRWGLDNWIYAVNGINSGGTITGPHLAQPVTLGATCFRFKSDGSRLEPVSGSAAGFGQAISDWGDRFLVTNQQHALYVAPLDHRYLARNPYYAAPNLVVNISSYGTPARVYPTSQPDPWRLARSKDPAWVKFYGVAEATANGFFTAASGQCIYQADQFPPEYRGNHFSVDNAQNMVHRCLLAPDGVSFTVRRPREDEQREFLTSTEQWFRPVNLMNGPDGALYVVDMYRSIIEDYSAIPRFLQQIYIECLIAGGDMGRIYRVVWSGAPARTRRFDLTKAAVGELVEKLESGNIYWRQTAQRLLVERGDKTAAEPLSRLVREGKTPQARLHALYALDGLDCLDPALVEHALGDPHFAVRMHALRLAERWLDKVPAITQRVLCMVGDNEPRVRLQLALTLGESRDPRAVQALSQLAREHGNDAWMQAAVISSVPDTAAALLDQLVRGTGDAGQSHALVRPLASVVGARHDDREIGTLLASIAAAQAEGAAVLQAACLDGLIEGLKRGKPSVLRSRPGQEGLRRLLASPDGHVQELALHVAGLLQFRESEEMKAAFAASAKTALDDQRGLEERLAAVALLTAAPYDVLAPVVEALLDARRPLDLQLAAVKAATPIDDPRIAQVLLAKWPSFTPRTQTAVIDAVFSRQNRLPQFLDAVESQAVPLASLEPIRRVQLLENPDAQIRQRAKTLLAGLGARKDRQEILARYQAALAGQRSAAHGKEVYAKQCAKCHKVQGEGYVVGPDLSSTTQRTDEMLVSDVLDPSNQITVGYNNYTVVTEDGKIFTGVLAAETATSVTLRREQGAEDTILRKDIEEMAASTISMMPENLEKEVSPQDVADLIAYLREAFGAPSTMITLFEDERAFVELLKEGDGTVSLETTDRCSGTASLRVTPPQRWSLRIPGWEYRIREKPGPGEYRYLRFAWKSRGGKGIMVELAGEGHWPPADKPLWRYYSGANLTGWAAVQVAPTAPQEWTVVTRDLWKDFGDFTLTGIAPTAIGGEALFDRIELLRALDVPK